MQYLHEQCFIHGTIQGANVLVSGRHNALLGDFGIAKFPRAGASVALAGPGSVRWKSPELLMGGSKSYASDVYAFAMTIYEVLRAITLTIRNADPSPLPRFIDSKRTCSFLR